MAGRKREPVEVRRATYVKHAEGVAERAIETVLADSRAWQNPVIRLRYSHGLLTRTDTLQTERQLAIDDLRAMKWSWAEVAEVMGVTRQRAHKIGTTKTDHA